MGSCPDAPPAVIVAWLLTVPSVDESTVTRNTTVDVALGASVPPAADVAPVPTRTRTVREAETYSPWSSALASVLVPTLAPDVTRIDPGTNVTPAGSTSASATPVAVSNPLLMTLIVYSRVSPRSTAPPLWLTRSATVLLLVDSSGRMVAIEVMNEPITYASTLVFAPTVALVSPGDTRAVTSTTSMSTLLMLSLVPASRGRSPLLETALPRYEREPLKNLFDGFTASDTATVS